jgi:hypothetical protein
VSKHSEKIAAWKKEKHKRRKKYFIWQINNFRMKWLHYLQHLSKSDFKENKTRQSFRISYPSCLIS